jgi:hypothetical protein
MSLKVYSNVSLKRLWWRVMGHWKGYTDMSLKRPQWYVTEKAYVTGHWKGSINMFLLNYRSNYYSLLEPIKVVHQERRMHTHKSETMGSKEPEPWSPRWLRHEHRKDFSGLPPNDPNHDCKPPVDTERPLCQCGLDCTPLMSLDHDMYDMRYWVCPFPTSLFNWGWDTEKPRKVVSVLHLHCIFLIMSSLTIIFSCRVFVLNFSHHHRNRQDVISRTGLMTIWHQRTKSTWRGSRVMNLPWENITVGQAVSSRVYCNLFYFVIKLLFHFPKACQV